MNPAEDRRKAGAFLVAAVALLVVVLGAIAGVRILTREKVYYVEFIESVSGLEPSSPVKYNGVPVGTVASIQFKPWDVARILVEIRVNADAPVKADTRAQLKPQGITGIFYLELYGGTQDMPELEEGETIPSDPSLTTAITGIARNLGELVARLNEFFAVNFGPLTDAIADIRAAAGAARTTLERLDGLVESGQATLAEVRGTIAAVGEEVGAAAKAARATLASLDAFLADPDLRALPGKAVGVVDAARATVEGVDLRGLVEDARAAVAGFRAVEESLGRAAASLADITSGAETDVAAALADIRAATGHVREATRLLRDDPGRLLRRPPATDRAFPDPLPPEETRR